MIRRAAIFVVLLVAAGGAGLVWAQERADTVVDATVGAEIAAEIHADGVLAVTERIRVDPANAGGLLRRALPVAEGTAVRVLSVTDAAGAPLDAPVTDLGDEVVVTLPEPAAPTEYVVDYEVVGAVEPHADVAELAWRVFDASNPLVLDDLLVDVSWDAQAGAPLLAAPEAEGHDVGVVERPGGFRWDAGTLPAHRPAELHAAFDLAAVEALAPSDLAVLETMRTAADPSPMAGRALDLVPLVVAAVFLVGWLAVQRTKGVEHRVTDVGRQVAPPSDHPPAEIGWLLRFGVTKPADLTATILDLERRGLLVVDGGTVRRADPGPNWVSPAPHMASATPSFGPRAGALRPYEQVVLDWLFPAGETTVDLAEREQRIRALPEGWQRFWTRFRELLAEQGAADGLVSRAAEAESVLAVAFCAALVMVGGVVGTAQGRPTWLACVAAGALVLVSSDTFARRSPEGAHLAARWEAFGEHLDRAAKVPPAWLPAAVPLGRLDRAVAGVGPDVAARSAVTVAAAVDRWQAAHVAATSLNAEPSAKVAAALARVRGRLASP